MDCQNDSASKTSLIQQVAHAETSRSGASEKRINLILINMQEKHNGMRRGRGAEMQNTLVTMQHVEKPLWQSSSI
jgi:hypothetical protein